jgi:hypothetical protein
MSQSRQKHVLILPMYTNVLQVEGIAICMVEELFNVYIKQVALRNRLQLLIS